MAINTLADWTANGSPSRQSILGRPRRKDGREYPEANEDEVLRSRTTDHHIQTFFDALEAGDESEQSHALAKIVQSWRADNNAGGLPVYAHLPLPSAFANGLANLTRSGQNGKPATEGVTARLEAGARVSVLQQLREAAGNRPRDASPIATVDEYSAFTGEYAGENPMSSFVTVQARAERPTQPPLRPSYAPTGHPPGHPRQAAQQHATQQKDPSWSQQKPLLPPEEGGEGALEPVPNPNGRFANPKVDPLEYPPPGYEYGAWEKAQQPKTSTGSLLVSPARLTQRQQQNLLDRVWISPTERQVGGGRLKDGRGYFGADRLGAGPPRHGGYDAPYKFPWEGDNDEQGKPRSRAVRLPTRAVYTGFEPLASDGKTVLNRLTFDLGDGLTLELLHVQLTPALDAKIKAARRSGKPLELDAGEVLGDVDATHDHTHIQIIASGPNGERWVVDPTYFMEKRARTFLRDPLPDSWERWIDTGRDAVDWAKRQFE
ncbi:MAG: hypothetical protein ACKVRO_08680 [Micropepsaceae bacterium]